MDRTELDLGAQTRAAAVVGDALTPLQDSLRRLASTIESEQHGFRGGAAAGFNEAARAWFEAAQDLLPALVKLQQGLVATDERVGRTDTKEAARFGRIGEVLGGAP